LDNIISGTPLRETFGMNERRAWSKTGFLLSGIPKTLYLTVNSTG
jgi:hypothetical protein